MSRYLVWLFIALIISAVNTTIVNATPQTLKREHIEKKVQLVEFILADIKQRAGELFESNQLFNDGYNYAFAELSKAKTALANHETVAANDALNQAFINMSYVRSFLKKATPSTAQQEEKYQKINTDVSEFISALEQWLSNSVDQQASEQLKQAKQLSAQANELAQQQKFSQAKSKLDTAYQGLVTSIARVRDKETTVISLNFTNPKDEYVYEQKRLESFNMLLKLRQKSTTLNDSTNKLILKYVGKSQENEHNANTAMTNNDYREAITQLEAANENLKKALRITGLNML